MHFSRLLKRAVWTFWTTPISRRPISRLKCHCLRSNMFRFVTICFSLSIFPPPPPPPKKKKKKNLCMWNETLVSIIFLQVLFGLDIKTKMSIWNHEIRIIYMYVGGGGGGVNTLLKSDVTSRDLMVRCRGSQECGSRFVNFACQFHWRWHESSHNSEIYNIVVHVQ